MMEVTGYAVVPAPLDKVWELVCDTGRYAEWVEGTDEVTRTDGPAAPGLHLRRDQPDPRAVEGEDALDRHGVRGAAPHGAPRNRPAALGGVRRDLRAGAGGRLHGAHADPARQARHGTCRRACSSASWRGRSRATTRSPWTTSRRWPRASSSLSASSSPAQHRSPRPAGTLAPRWRTTDSSARATTRRRWRAACSPSGRTRASSTPSPSGDARGELLDRRPAAQRDRLAAHGPRAERHDPGRAACGWPGCAACAPSGSTAPTTRASPRSA